MKEKKPLNVQIGSRIKAARISAGMTQAVLAERIGVSDQYISDLERGVVGASIQTIIDICYVLSVTSDSLLFGVIDTPVGNRLRHLDGLPMAEYRLVESAVNIVLEALAYNSSQE